jgi:hypothetical protein
VGAHFCEQQRVRRWSILQKNTKFEGRNANWRPLSVVVARGRKNPGRMPNCCPKASDRAPRGLVLPKSPKIRPTPGQSRKLPRTPTNQAVTPKRRTSVQARHKGVAEQQSPRSRERPGRDQHAEA